MSNEAQTTDTDVTPDICGEHGGRDNYCVLPAGHQGSHWNGASFYYD